MIDCRFVRKSTHDIAMTERFLSSQTFRQLADWDPGVESILPIIPHHLENIVV
jgi:hypothetical protein